MRKQLHVFQRKVITYQEILQRFRIAHKIFWSLTITQGETMIKLFSMNTVAFDNKIFVEQEYHLTILESFTGLNY